MNKQPLPELGKRYHFFEDGKSGPGRHYIVEITKIIPFEAVTDGELLDTYNVEVEEADFLYAPETDYFVYGKKVLSDKCSAPARGVATRIANPNFDGVRCAALNTLVLQVYAGSAACIVDGYPLAVD